MLKATNSARALHDLSTYASLYVPIASIPLHIPTYVSLNRLSPWHTSALLIAAIESVALPFRLRGDGRRRTTFSDFEAALNTNGNQRIGQLTFSALDPHVSKDKLRLVVGPSHGDRRAGNPLYSHALVEEDGQETRDIAETNLDIDLLPRGMKESPASLMRLGKAVHCFGRVESFRGPFATLGVETPYDDDEASRKRRRLHGVPILERSVSRTIFLSSRIS